MNTESRRARYTSLLRTRQKGQTTVLILEAVASILRRADVSAVTISEVARVAEVTERTVYRHFKTRDELLKAFWPWQLEQMGGPFTNRPRSLEAFLKTLPVLYAGWEREEGLVRAIFFSAEARAIRGPVTANYMNHISEFLSELLPDATLDERRQVAAPIVFLCSVANWIFMRDSCGYTGQQAAEATVRGIKLILEGARREGRAA
ncbi:TetR/AcrR family transcriptional regulator [Phenylobacterium montanum]|uniref:TetR/AcrR family transcriptional regulator n=1 Tax=Phenylobacterium montanum TaxID=2823693 RepID=A0A975G354_9CAUL|nr:TetR/AcrR family transcriptional regulator [Caulobacter sp. S6]QUD89826.1 TetR/AcrR family transcriptional regulator [Caulobacter sp. S6]